MTITSTARQMSGRAHVAAVLDRLRAGETIVANVKTDTDLIAAARAAGLYVYAGRPRGWREGKDIGWGNPYEIGTHGDRETVIRRHRTEHLPARPDLRARLDAGELVGKLLGCYCAPLACHADTLAQHSSAARGTR